METPYELTLGQTLQLFYKYGLSTLPVVNERSELIGTFEKSDAVRLGTLRARLEEKLASHLRQLMLPAGPAVEPRLKRLLFEKSRTVPVLDFDGKLSHFWHVGDGAAALDEEIPLPYRRLFTALVEGVRRPLAVVFQEPRAGEAANAAFLRRLSLTKSQVRPWLESVRWQDGAASSAVAFQEDGAGLPLTLIRTPLALQDGCAAGQPAPHYGWMIEILEEYEMASDVICAAVAPASNLRRKIGVQGLKRVVNAFESYLIKRGMAGSPGDVRRLTALLGVSRQSLRYKLKKHRLTGKK